MRRFQHDEITVTDLFCGAGGSSSGLKQLDGVIVRQAANHWRTAVDTHNANHPEADHDCADISQVDPRRYPRTTLLWASPECTNHSGAKGVKRTAQLDLFSDRVDEAAERSRATMWDVARFAEFHRYAGFIVENVVEATKWIGWRGWRLTLEDMGYCLHTVFLNSAFASQLGAPAPQSRDRLYVVGHLKASKCPDLDRWTRPQAWCPTCSQSVQAIQAWKKTTPGGKYRAQYVWRCPNVSCRNVEVDPYVLPAAAVIDWSNPGSCIGDRDKPLAAKTMARIDKQMEKLAALGSSKPLPPAHIFFILTVVQCLVAGCTINAIVALGEETGWRGWLLSALSPLGTTRAVVFTGAVWGLWHAPLIAMGYEYEHQIPAALGIVLFTMFCMAFGTLLAWLRARSGSIWPAAITHGTLNAFATLPPILVAPEDSWDLVTSSIAGVPAVLMIMAIAAVLLSRQRIELTSGTRPEALDNMT